MLTDRWTHALAAATCIGAWLAVGIPAWIGGVLVAAGLGRRRAWLVVLGAALAAGALSARAEQGLREPLDAVIDSEVMIVADPVWFDDSLRLTIRADGRRYDAWARGGPARDLEHRLVGERVNVRATIKPLGDRSRWLRWRHIAGRASVIEVGTHRSAPAPVAVANAFRRNLADGAVSLEQRSLFTGLVYGDDRAQSELVTAQFRASGLSHLLAVSGQNVAFVLTVAGPLLRRLLLPTRLAVTIIVLVLFATVTRFEPSVLRATVMAGLAASAATIGRDAAGLRLLGLAITGLVLVDPFLVHNLGFQLSVAASGGILALAGPIRAPMPGPTWMSEPLSITLAAQLAVAPLLVGVFGSVPLVSIPANLAAAPAAGYVMVYGLVAGTIAGLVGEPLATAIHVPTGWLLAWIAGVARRASALPVGEWGWGQLAGGAIGFALWLRWREPDESAPLQSPR